MNAVTVLLFSILFIYMCIFLKIHFLQVPPLTHKSPSGRFIASLPHRLRSALRHTAFTDDTDDDRAHICSLNSNIEEIGINTNFEDRLKEELRVLSIGCESLKK
jgi:hypothetical protein